MGTVISPLNSTLSILDFGLPVFLSQFFLKERQVKIDFLELTQSNIFVGVCLHLCLKKKIIVVKGEMNNNNFSHLNLYHNWIIVHVDNKFNQPRMSNEVNVKESISLTFLNSALSTLDSGLPVLCNQTFLLIRVLISKKINIANYIHKMKEETYIFSTWAASPSSWPTTVPCGVFMHHPRRPSSLPCFWVYCNNNYPDTVVTIQWITWNNFPQRAVKKLVSK